VFQDKPIAAVILARTQSSRLKGKMTLPFAGHETVVEAVISRIRRSALIEEIVFATSDNPADDRFVEITNRAGIRLIRGDENDVVGRMKLAIDALDTPPYAIAKVCADNPLLMPTLVDDALIQLLDEDLDVVTPFEFNSYPFGFSLVCMTTNCLNRINSEAKEMLYREHVENYCFDHADKFSIGYQIAPTDLSWPELCLTLDYEVDFERLKAYAKVIAQTPVEQQPNAVINKIRQTRLGIIGLKSVGFIAELEHPPTIFNDVEMLAGKEFDLILSSDDLSDRPDISAAQGVVWPNVIAGQLLCRYENGNVVVVHESAARSGETDAEYLFRQLTQVIRHLLAGPPRPVRRRHKSGEKMKLKAEAQRLQVDHNAG
jgi:spore coat polysaccharide biosynthesis protein SpsF